MTTSNPMQLGMIGLGRMGANIVRRLMRDGHSTVAYDVNKDAVAALAAEGAVGADTLEAFVAALTTPRAIWVMVPAGYVQDTLAKSPQLEEFAGRVSDSGEGRWTVLAAIDEGVPASVITAALYERFESRGNGMFTDKLMSAMRNEFGGHDEKPKA